jgi:hypothetical protein
MKILTIPNDNIIRVCNLLNQLIGDVTSKNLFTGYGLFHKNKDMLPFDLHVLSLPPAFNLSHDQTLQFKFNRSILLT